MSYDDYLKAFLLWNVGLFIQKYRKSRRSSSHSGKAATAVLAHSVSHGSKARKDSVGSMECGRLGIKAPVAPWKISQGSLNETQSRST